MVTVSGGVNAGGLTFNATNGGAGYTGLRVEMTGSYSLPEPASLSVVGLLGVFAARRRRV